jgi:hypothetical protein
LSLYVVLVVVGLLAPSDWRETPPEESGADVREMYRDSKIPVEEDDITLFISVVSLGLHAFICCGVVYQLVHWNPLNFLQTEPTEHDAVLSILLILLWAFTYGPLLAVAFTFVAIFWLVLLVMLNIDNALMANMYCIELKKEAQGASSGIKDGTRANL